MVSKYDKLGTIWTISGFLGIIGLGFVYNSEERELWSWEVMSLVIFTATAFVLALHFTMHDFAKKEKKNDE